MNTVPSANNEGPSGRMPLSEFESRKILAKYNIPVVNERVAETAEDAVKAAEEMGFPVVLKGFGASLLHKTEQGLVHLGIKDHQEVKKAAQATMKNAGKSLEGILVQPHVDGKREFVAGMFRDREFGQVIMFGLGGIFTEALSDVSFRLAPLSESDIKDMIHEIRSASLLENVRGQQAVKMDQLTQALMGLSTLSLEQPDIVEIDINPLLIKADGSVCAVDALIIKDKETNKIDYLPSVSPNSIGYFFYPKPIAFIGASNSIGKWGHTLPACTISGGFKGDIYLVNPRGGKIMGREAYKSVADIPGNVDLVVVTIPASKVLDLIPQLKAKGIRDMLLISSGFGEIGEEGKQLELELVKKAREANILVLGPNTMGICNPHINLYCTGVHLKPSAGTTSIVSQSGNMGTQLLAFAKQQGIGIRGFCGSGNEAMVAIEDFLDCFEADDLTNTVMLYVESVKNGRRFFESAKRVVKKKPVVLLKGGQSKAGNIAASSHTGAMASNSNVFEAMCKQSGIIKVNQSMEMLDLAACFSSLPLPKGNRTAIMTLGGGWGVVTADLCENYGLEVPKLSSGIIAKIDKILPPYWSRANPIDLVGESDNTLPFVVLEELMKWDDCDAVINLGILGKKGMGRNLAESTIIADPTSHSKDFVNVVVESISQFEEEYIEHTINMMCKYNKPVYGVSILSDNDSQTVYSVKDYQYSGIFFPTPERAVKSMSRMYEHYDYLEKHR